MKHFTAVCIFLSSAISASTLQAQGVGWTITPKIGVFAPLTNLVETDSTESKLATSLALGLALEIDFRTAPLSIRANVDVATNGELEGAGTGGVTAVDQLNLVGDLLIRPFSRNYILQPYLVAGAGMKRYTFSDDEFDISTSDQMFTGHLGAGIILDWGSIKLSAELSDYISSWEASPTENTTQHDLFGMVGLRIPLN